MPRSLYTRGVTEIASATLKVGLEVHVELATRSKMFSRVGNPAHPDFYEAPPNSLIDPVVLGLPGALPVLNKVAIDMAMLVGMALGCSIAKFTKWDRKSYFYPDLPKNYQISQYDLPLCFDGAVDVPEPTDAGDSKAVRIGIIRAHLEEDAGKLLHEWPGGKPIDFSIIDFNRAGTPLLEIVTAPDFTTADQVVAFARMLRTVCRFLGVSHGVMQRGHMRFEPNINMILRLGDGHQAATPIVEIKNLNSFKSLKAAIEHEAAEQPRRFLADGRVMGPGAKTTRGWDDARGVTVLQREKEDAHDYRYFPDPDLPPVVIDEAWQAQVRQRLPELPAQRERRYSDEFGLSAREAQALVDERETCELFEGALEEAAAGPGARADPAHRERAGRLVANLMLQSGLKRANERGVELGELGITPARLGALARLRIADRVSAAGADALFGRLCEGDADPEQLAQEMGLLQVRDNAALAAWCEEAISAQPQAAADVKAGKVAAIGRLVGEVMKRSGGRADAKAVREALLARLRA